MFFKRKPTMSATEVLLHSAIDDYEATIKIMTEHRKLLEKRIAELEGPTLRVTEALQPNVIKAQDELLQQARKLIITLVTNDPNETISDAGHTVLDAWRYNARKLLERMGVRDDAILDRRRPDGDGGRGDATSVDAG